MEILKRPARTQSSACSNRDRSSLKSWFKTVEILFILTLHTLSVKKELILVWCSGPVLHIEQRRRGLLHGNNLFVRTRTFCRLKCKQFSCDQCHFSFERKMIRISTWLNLIPMYSLCNTQQFLISVSKIFWIYLEFQFLPNMLHSSGFFNQPFWCENPFKKGKFECQIWFE